MTAWRIRVTGTVQGVGFRPAVARLARAERLRGWVCNDIHGVEIALAGDEPTVRAFVERLRAGAPPAAHITSVDLARAPDLAPASLEGFTILESPTDAAAAPDAAITPDLALCDACRAELTDPTNRRHHYAFINCTQCGPRYSILESLPYDRPRTTMRPFTMCPECAQEYADPEDRRYHAEPNACPFCGPAVRLLDRSGTVIAGREDAVARAAEAILAGEIVAVKGIGGYHLFCDATSEPAVRELRRRKHREEKPFAVMFPTLAALEVVAMVDPAARALLQSPAAPVVLVPKRLDDTGDPDALAPSVAPDNPWIGALLPYAPLHVELLAEVGGPVVATSANVSEEPLCIDEAEALARLTGIADAYLAHNRRIARPVDDSVIRLTAGAPIVLRRARGLAPTPLPLPPDAHTDVPLLAVGGHMKNTIAVTAGDRLVLSPHIGDLANPAAVDAFERTVDLLGSLYGGRFGRVACDAHPDYTSTTYARRLGLPVTPVQHHLAHILACLLEHGGGPECVLGVSWDGTGHGTDGTIWGGEFILINRAARTARRVAHLRAFRLPGGEAAVREPRRTALGLLHEIMGADHPRFRVEALEHGFGEDGARLLAHMLAQRTHAPVTSSAGRLFDGVASLLGLADRSGFEGQAAMQVESAAARHSGPVAALPFFLEMSPGGVVTVDWRPMIDSLLARRGHEPAAALAAAFHAALAAAVVTIAESIGVGAVALSGGCFQNACLLDLTTHGLRAAKFDVLVHHDLPPNDGGLAAGQALGALWGLTDVAPG
ncbi:MAG: carbamoyltransferase HypF [Opitutaceae bacterium]|nr:carbamoyltransferase HypF [Opitutaceae bacterium]